jgi:hypothetical protein
MKGSYIVGHERGSIFVSMCRVYFVSTEKYFYVSM